MLSFNQWRIKPPKPIVNTRREEIRKLISMRWSCADIADVLGMGRHDVRGYARRMGLTFAKGKPQ